MGERLNDGAGHSRRRARPPHIADAAADVEAPATADTPRTATPALEALLVRALRARAPRGTGDGERRAVAAFRAARDAGAHQARTRRRDDWRPRARRHTARSLRATLSVLVAGLALGGVAFAAVGSAGDGHADAAGRPEGSATASRARSTGASASPPPTVPADRDRPLGAKDTEAHCRAYEKVHGRGRAMDSTAWQRLVTAAGGEGNVAAYCAARDGLNVEKSAKAGRTAKAQKSAKADKSAKAQKTAKADKSAKAQKTAKADKSAKAQKTANAGRSPKAGGTADPDTAPEAAKSPQAEEIRKAAKAH
ncbi:hypothetical protein ACFWBB_13735 [Streptomyces sp. NPDC060000]|uniref:hypothetical protein n=1 Tax=Streptomyces sp. NPDC060000 TaxID=3347031 RepID=UPI0036A10891